MNVYILMVDSGSDSLMELHYVFWNYFLGNSMLTGQFTIFYENKISLRFIYVTERERFFMH